MRLDGELWWVLHGECPITQRYMHDRELDILAYLTRRFEEELSEEDLASWILQDKVSQGVEAFSSEPAKVLPLRRYKAQTEFI